ncbi:MAG: hypothetical protein WC444_06085 [Candidatus Paceibacterota bacterium]
MTFSDAIKQMRQRELEADNQPVNTDGLMEHERQLIEGMTVKQARSLIFRINQINSLCRLKRFGTTIEPRYKP